LTGSGVTAAMSSMPGMREKCSGHRVTQPCNTTNTLS
jgi:hypothetical protein